MAEDDDIISRVADLYNAFMDEKYSEVRRLCLAHPEDVLRKISIYKDTVLHMAAHSKRNYHVLELLKILPATADCNRELCDVKNKDGNTILHEVATGDTMKEAAEELLKRNSELLTACNELGEKPIFCAARYGQTQMFEFLAEKMELEKLSPEESKAHLQRIDGTTVLHISIATECFGLAHHIAAKYSYLIKERDGASMTALQYLACNPSVFPKRKVHAKGGFIGEIITKYETESMRHVIGDVTGCFNLFRGKPFGIHRRGKKRDKRNKLQELIMLLVKSDPSLDASINSEGANPDESRQSNESPLFLATKLDIPEIVEAILELQPQAFMHTNKKGMNILHVAIFYRHIDIFDVVVKSGVLARRLLLATDKRGNSVLHMVGQKRKSQPNETMRNPALQLRDELVLFKKVKSACKMLSTNPLNKGKKTAEELFAATNEQLHQEAREWLMRTTENCSILSIFIATVAFAAAYTVPGGPNQNTGIPLLQSKPFFAIFILADVTSLTLALASVGIFISILTSSFPLKDFEAYLLRKLILGTVCMILSVLIMVVAFGATICLTFRVTVSGYPIPLLSLAGFLPVPIFFVSCSPLRSAFLGFCMEVLQTILIFLMCFVFPPACLAFLIIFIVGLLLLAIAYMGLVLVVVLCVSLYLVWEKLLRPLKKAYEFARFKPVLRIRGSTSCV